MIARLYSNENFPLPVVEALRLRGHDVLTTRDAGKANEGIPDAEMLEFACQAGRAVITHNRKDFIRLHRTKPDFPALAEQIHRQLGCMTSLKGQLVRVNRGE